MNKKVVLEGNGILTTPLEGETLLDQKTDGELDLTTYISGESSLETYIDGDLDLDSQIDGEMGTYYQIGSGGGNSVWGSIIGNINNQTDLIDILDSKANSNDIPTKTSDLANDSGFISEWVHDLGEFSIEDYDLDFGEYLNDIGLVESGFYKAHDTVDDFDYYIIVERAGNEVYQEYWYSEDSSTYRQIRSGYSDGESWSFDDWDNYMTSNNAYNDFALKNHSHFIEETVNYSNILTYFNTFNQNKQVGQYKIINTNGNNVYYLTYDCRYISGLSGNYRFYQEYVTNIDDYIHIRFGTRSGNSIVWGAWRHYPDENNIANNYYNMDYIDDTYYTKEEVDNLIAGGGGGGGLIATTWANLVELRDNAELVKGAYYRITDYNFVTTKLGVQSGNHQFDIVLLAISESMLSESAYAVKHAGDHYFEREVTEGGIEWLYTIYVDDYAENYGDEPVDHADDMHPGDVFCDSGVLPHPGTGIEVPVLYKTDGQEYSIDDPDYEDAYFYESTYDLDGDEYDLWAKYEQQDGEWVFMQQYALTPIVVEDGELIVSPIPETKTVPVNMNAWELKYCLDNDKELFNWAETEGKGVIYWLKDEFGNEAPYDFKNVLFRRKNITRVSSNDLSIFTQGEYSRLGLLSNYGITCGDNNYYYYTFDTPFNAGNDSSLFGDSAYNTIKPYILDGQRLINNIVLGVANNNTIGSNCYDLTLWGTVGENNLTYNCSNLLVVGLSQTIMTYVRSTTFFSLGSTTFGSGCFQNIGSMLTNSEIGDGCNNNSFGTGNMGIKMGNGCSGNTFGTFNYNNTFESGVANCKLGNYVSYCEFGIAAVDITLPNYVRYCKFEPDIHKIKFTTSGGSTSRYIQYVTVCRGISNLTVAPPRNTAYEQIYYKTGRIETAV